MLGGIKRTDSDSAMEPLVRTDRNMMNRRLNDVFLTPSGVKFTKAWPSISTDYWLAPLIERNRRTTSAIRTFPDSNQIAIANKLTGFSEC